MAVRSLALTVSGILISRVLSRYSTQAPQLLFWRFEFANSSRSEVCGSDRRTYPNACELRKAQCETQTTIKIAGAGSCHGKTLRLRLRYIFTFHRPYAFTSVFVLQTYARGALTVAVTTASLPLAVSDTRDAQVHYMWTSCNEYALVFHATRNCTL